MFSNLSKGSVLYGLDKREGVSLFTTTVDNISMAFPNMMSMPIGQTVLNIKATVKGKQGDFLNIPSNNAIYDMGNMVLADNKESLINYATMELQNSKAVVNSIDTHKKLINEYEKILAELNPVIASNNTEVKELRSEISDLKGQLIEALSLLKDKSKNGGLDYDSTKT